MTSERERRDQSDRSVKRDTPRESERRKEAIWEDVKTRSFSGDKTERARERKKKTKA